MQPSSPFRSAKLTAFVATSDAKRAKAFYADTLGFSLTTEDPFALVFDANGTPLRVAIVGKVAAPPYTVLGWQVPDITTAAKYLANSGVALERYEAMRQDELGIWRSPGGALIGWFKDPDGNTLSISQD